MEEALNKIQTRVAIGFFIGIPITLATIFASIYSLSFGIAGLAQGNLYTLSMGLVNIAGIIGILGAWKRLFKTSNKMSESEKENIRAMLTIGLLSSLAISVFLITTTEYLYALAFVTISSGAALLIYATPKNSNNSINADTKPQA